MSQTHDQKRFTISEVAADWHELMIPQHIMRPSIAHDSEQLDGSMVIDRQIDTVTITALIQPLADIGLRNKAYIL